jgi:hypothetical protein
VQNRQLLEAFAEFRLHIELIRRGPVSHEVQRAT